MVKGITEALGKMVTIPNILPFTTLQRGRRREGKYYSEMTICVNIV